MAKHCDGFGKFVRPKLIGEIVEVVSFDSEEVTIDFKGQNVTLKHYEVSCITSKKQKQLLQQPAFQSQICVESNSSTVTEQSCARWNHLTAHLPECYFSHLLCGRGGALCLRAV